MFALVPNLRRQKLECFLLSQYRHTIRVLNVSEMHLYGACGIEQSCIGICINARFYIELFWNISLAKVFIVYHSAWIIIETSTKRLNTIYLCVWNILYIELRAILLNTHVENYFSYVSSFLGHVYILQRDISFFMCVIYLLKLSNWNIGFNVMYNC